MQYSPKLKKAAEDIKKILEEYDINAAVFLHTPGFAEYLHKVNASYSCAHIKQGELIFDRGTRFTRPEKQRQKIRDTANFLRLAAIHQGRSAQLFMDASDIFDQWSGAVHGDTEHTSQDEIDN